MVRNCHTVYYKIIGNAVVFALFLYCVLEARFDYIAKTWHMDSWHNYAYDKDKITIELIN